MGGLYDYQESPDKSKNIQTIGQQMLHAHHDRSKTLVLKFFTSFYIHWAADQTVFKYCANGLTTRLQA
jgi:hypothetical protein